MSAHGSRRGRAVHQLWSLLAIPGVLFSAGVRADTQDAPWQFSLTPYLWLPRVDAEMRYETPGSGGSPVSLTNLLQHLNAALFLSGEARKDRWGLAADLVFCDFQKTGSSVSTVGGPNGEMEVPVNTGTTTSLTGYMVSLTGNYSLMQRADAKLDLLTGLRYTHIGTTLDWSFAASVDSLPARTGSVGQGADLWDGIVGLRGKVELGEGKWFVPYYLDAGAGSSNFTWQALLGIGYSFGWGDLLLVYRDLSFEQGDEHRIEHLYFAGPALGATFHF
jgi:hypothetical protein